MECTATSTLSPDKRATDQFVLEARFRIAVAVAEKVGVAETATDFSSDAPERQQVMVL